jgi:hypothetical protein
MQASEQTTTNENKQIIDGCFYVVKQKYGTFNSYDLEDKALITSLTEDLCISATRFYLKGLQEGFEDAKIYSSIVEGKL